MNINLDGQRALVSGSTVGIGYAIAEELARHGAHVTLNGRTQARIDAALAQLRAAVPSAKVDGIVADLGTESGAKLVFEKLPELDILINNLGIFEVAEFAQISDDDWRRFFEVNVLSGARLARHYLPGMLTRNAGRVVFISSESALQIPAEMIHYGMTKSAQISIASGLAQLTKGTRVTVNSVLPGPTRSEGVGTFVKNFAEKQGVSTAEFEQQFFKTARPTSLLQRFIEPEEVARVVAFVASPLASAMNGSAVRAEGGLLLSAF